MPVEHARALLPLPQFDDLVTVDEDIIDPLVEKCEEYIQVRAASSALPAAAAAAAPCRLCVLSSLSSLLTQTPSSPTHARLPCSLSTSTRSTRCKT